MESAAATANILQEDAVFLNQNPHVKYFNIQNFTTNFLGNIQASREDTSSLVVSRETLSERENEKSPLFFKISGCVAYCTQLSGCCIFYHRGITEHQMKILYSVPCQNEIYEQACKLYANTIPCYKNLLQYTFSIKDKDKFKRLGLSEDTILLKVKNELPSRRNKFIYSAALLQLQMLRYDFIITPNLTQYYMKQYIGGIQQQSCVFPPPPLPTTTPATGCLVNRQNTTSTLTVDKHTTSSPVHVNASDFNVNHKKTKCSTSLNADVNILQNEQNKESEDERDSTDEDDDISETETEDDDENSQDRIVVVKNPDAKAEKQNKDVNQGPIALPSTFRNLKRKPASLVSSSNTESIKSSDASHVSSVEFVTKQKGGPGSVRSTGITEVFRRLDTKVYCPSSTGVTENIDDLCIDDIAPADLFEDDDNRPGTSVKSMLTDYSDLDAKYPVEDINVLGGNSKQQPSIQNFTMYDNGGYVYYDPDFLLQFISNNNPEFVLHLFDNFRDLHGDIKSYIRQKGYARGDPVKIKLALADIRRHPTDRLKQAVFLYLISNLITLTD